MKAPWILRVLWDTDDVLDLKDDEGKPDHGKSVGLLAFLCFVALIAVGIIPPSIGIVIVLIAAIFGQRVFIAFLRSRTVTSNEQVVKWEGPIEEPRAREIHPDEDD